MPSRCWRHRLGRNYRDVINRARSIGLIDANERYSTTRKFTKSYRLADRYRHGNTQQFELTYRSQIRRSQSVCKPKAVELGEVATCMAKLQQRFSLSPDAVVDPLLRSDWKGFVVARWLNGQYFAIRCPYGRLHTLISQTPRMARSYFQIDRQPVPLQIVDVSACQPMLLGHLATRKPTGHTAPSRATLLSYVAHFFSECEDTTTTSDARKWIELCEAGELYQYLQHRLIAGGDTRTTLPSGVTVDLAGMGYRPFKKAALVPLFDRQSRTVRSPIFRLLRAEFPTIASFVEWAKRPQHSTLACLLQRLESSIMVDGAAAICYAGILTNHLPRSTTRSFADRPCRPAMPLNNILPA